MVPLGKLERSELGMRGLANHGGIQDDIGSHFVQTISLYTHPSLT